MPDPWDMLPDKKRVGSGWEPPLLLILAAWDSPHLMKISRLEGHIRYAAERGAFDKVNAFLRDHKPEQWFRG